jgi:hypothetical protein
LETGKSKYRNAACDKPSAIQKKEDKESFAVGLLKKRPIKKEEFNLNTRE